MSNIEKCLNDIYLWMTANKLKLNKDKMELIYFYSKYSPQTSFIPLHFGDDLILPSQHIRDIGAIFDCSLSMTPQVNSVSQHSINCRTLLTLGSIYLPRPLSSLSMLLFHQS